LSSRVVAVVVEVTAAVVALVVSAQAQVYL
jgi:hypothetical protein